MQLTNNQSVLCSTILQKKNKSQIEFSKELCILKYQAFIKVFNILQYI